MKILPPTDRQPQPPALPGIPPFATLRLCAFALKTQSSSHNQVPIKAKTPAIVPHQGKSRQPMINHFTVMTPTRWIGRTGRRTVKACTQEKSSPGGEETGEGERPTKLSGRVAMPVCPRPSRSPKSETRTRFPPNQGKNPCNRASSRQIKANAQISKTPR